MKHATRSCRVVATMVVLALSAPPSVPAGFAAGIAGQAAAKPATPPAPAQPPAPTPTTKPAAPAGQQPAPSKPAAPAAKQPAAGAAAGAQAIDGGWPRFYDLPSGATLLMYQPQIASWDKQAHLVAFSAVSHRTKGAEKPAIGTVKLEADTKVAIDERLVSLEKLKISEANFQTLPKEQVQELVAQIDKAMPKDDRVIALDRVLANLDKSQIIPKTVEGIKADPPTIFFSKTPAVIINLDGEPIWSPIKENDLKYAVNTNWDLFQHAPTNNTLYLRNNDGWLRRPTSRGPGRRRARCPRASRSCPRKRTGRTSRRPFLASRSNPYPTSS
jgi:hypothetical protein